jgi:DNA-directed RNA polymerase specialized sigma24 family protein
VPGQQAGRHLRVDPASGEDPRRARKREIAEAVVARSEWLPQDEQALVRAVFRNGQSAAQVARLMGVEPRRVRRRVHRIVKRVMAPTFVLVVQQREQWSGTRRRVAEACFVRGLSIREASIELGVSLHTVRIHCGAVRHMLELRTAIAGQLQNQRRAS